MRKFLKVEIVLSALIVTFLVMIVVENSLAQQYFNLTEKVVSISRGALTVQGDKAETMNFAVGRNIVYQVEILPPLPPKK